MAARTHANTPMGTTAAAVLVFSLLGLQTAADASDYSHTCKIEGGLFVIDDGVLYEAQAYKSGITDKGISYRVVAETEHSDERGYCISWKERSPKQYEFRSRRYIQRVAFEHKGGTQQAEARCALYADGMPANLDCDRRVVTLRLGAPELREKGWGIEEERDETTTRWLHNGSGMELRADGDSRVFNYATPRRELEPYGVRPGTVLFDGQVVGPRLEGHARIFTKTCGELSFAVRGSLQQNGTRIVLKGKAPTTDAACKPVRWKDSELVFDAKPASIAGGGGSLPLEEAIAFAKGEPRLASALTALLLDARVNPLDVVCSGLALGDHWTNLSRTRIPPFECEVGKHTLVIEGAIEFLDRSGRVVGTAEDAGADMVPDVYRSATDLRFVRPRWTIKE